MTQIIRYILLFSFIPVFSSAFALAPPESHQSDTLVYRIDTLKSRIYWKCDIHNGYVLVKRGMLKVVDNKIVSGEIVMKMDSIVDLDIDYALMKGTLENVLRSDVFFDVKNFPEANFRIEDVEEIHSTTFQVTGDLKIKGIDNCIRFNSKMYIQNDSLIIQSEEFTINRLYWGITAYSEHIASSDDSFVVGDGIDFQISLVGYRED